MPLSCFEQKCNFSFIQNGKKITEYNLHFVAFLIQTLERLEKAFFLFSCVTYFLGGI